MFLFVASFSFRIHSPGDASRGQVNVSLSPSLHFSLSRPPPHLLPCCPMMLFCTILSWEGEQTREQHGGNREKLVWGIAWDSTRGLRVPMVPGRRVQVLLDQRRNIDYISVSYREKISDFYLVLIRSAICSNSPSDVVFCVGLLALLLELHIMEV